MESAEETLAGGFITSSVTRRGGAVLRSAGPWSVAVHSWLTHLSEKGLTLAPRPVSLDLAAGTEEVSYLPGAVLSGGASPSYLWLDGTLAGVAQLIRQFHDAAAGFQPPSSGEWQAVAASPEGGDVICHNDLAPWNTVFRDEQPAGFIDWDLAAPGPRWWDVAYALWHFLPLYGEPDSDPFDVTRFEPRGQRARLFCDAYGFTDRAHLPDQIVRRQLAVCEAIKNRARAGDEAYVRLWELGAGTGIQRQAEFVRANSRELASALA